MFIKIMASEEECRAMAKTFCHLGVLKLIIRKIDLEDIQLRAT